eukprot:CAMPEP_0115234128 /NCGR_PEP_ID=MMETSP0270-20121206/34631_1 /TAXON_ID=71861 /ORGANISM="Scrippsiella trochoidea, Strain CCMP3099" /LENGTH=271 /DNA_ID=CAMNT_0002648861 /DNA_START=1 /DNA_END=818 /DNA_ORIENTATION=+
MWNLPGEFRFINVQDSAVLQPVEPGLWFNAQMISFADLAKNDQAWKKDFKVVEDYWINELGAKPHMGKLMGFREQDNGEVEPFADEYVCTIYSNEQKQAFSAYREQLDPDGLFATGLGMKFLAPSRERALHSSAMHSRRLSRVSLQAAMTQHSNLARVFSAAGGSADLPRCQQLEFVVVACSCTGTVASALKDFKVVEDYWINELGAKPHMGKLMGFREQDNGEVEPFADEYVCTIYSDEQKRAFSSYREAADPEGLFATGLGMKFLAPCA